MKYLKRFNEEVDFKQNPIGYPSAGLSREIKDHLKDIEISLNDIKLGITYQEQTDQIVMYISGYDVLFSLADIKEEVEHIISLMEDSGHKLTSASYMNGRHRRHWQNIYNNKPNRWGVDQSKDFFDIQDYDINTKEVLSFELKFSN